MVTREDIDAAVDKAKDLLLECGLSVDTTTDELIDWFATELPQADIELGEVVLNPLLVVHELVEIDEMLKMGFVLTKDVIIKNPDKVDDAHLIAAKIEMKIARDIGAAEHIRDRIKDIERWCGEKALPESRRAEYRLLLTTTKGYLSDMDRRHIR